MPHKIWCIKKQIVNTFFLRLIEAKREQVLFAMPVPNI
jgi:hypothetical protein